MKPGSTAHSALTRESLREAAVPKDRAELLARFRAPARGFTPLHLAAWDQTRELARLLIARSADVNAPDARGRTPLAVAKLRGQKGVADVLAAAGGKE